MWLHRSYSNTIAIQKNQTRFDSAGTVVKWTLLPIIQFITPYQAMKEMYAILVKRDPKNDHKYRAPFLIKSWWFFWWTAFFLWLVSDKLGKGLVVFTRGGYINNGWLDFVGDLCDVVMILLTYRIISQIGANQVQNHTPAMPTVNPEYHPVIPNPTPEAPYLPYQPYNPESSSATAPRDTPIYPNSSSPLPPPPKNVQPQPAKPAEKKDDLEDTSRFTW